MKKNNKQINNKMNTKIRSHRGGALSLVVTLFTIAILSLSVKASSVLLDGTSVTNVNAAYNAPYATNSAGVLTVVTNNYQNGQVPGASNVMYQLSTSQGAQPSFGTNGFLPALVDNTAAGFPGSPSGPGKNVAIEISGALMATNATSTAVVLQFAMTDAGKVWTTNFFTAAYTVPINVTQPAGGVWTTNIDIGAHQYVALQQINNPGVAALTNIVVRIGNKPGL